MKHLLFKNIMTQPYQLSLTFNLIPIYLRCGWGVIMSSYLSCLCMMHNNLRNFWWLNMKAEWRPVRVLANISQQLQWKQPPAHWGKKTLKQNCQKIQKISEEATKHVVFLLVQRNMHLMPRGSQHIIVETSRFMHYSYNYCITASDQ